MSRIGVNALYLIPGEVGGTEVYLRELLAALAAIDRSNEYFVFGNRETGPELCPDQPNFHWAPLGVRAANRPARILWEQTVLPWRAGRLKLDVLLNPGYTSPLAAPCPMVTVFHDLQHTHHPENFRFLEHLALRFFLWQSAHRSRDLIAVSEATRRDLLAVYRRLPSGRVHTIHHGIDPAFSQLRPAADGGYLLCVSARRPNKNLERLLRALQLLRREKDFGLKLIIAGPNPGPEAQWELRLLELDLAGVEFTGWVDQQRLYKLYEGARALVYPSLFEGFGMPVVEAMAAGVPVACSSIAALREVAGDAALFFDPADEAGMAEAIVRIASDEPLRARLIEAGRLRASGFTWRKTAERTLEVLVGAGRGNG